MPAGSTTSSSLSKSRKKPTLITTPAITHLRQAPPNSRPTTITIAVLASTKPSQTNSSA